MGRGTSILTVVLLLAGAAGGVSWFHARGTAPQGGSADAPTEYGRRHPRARTETATFSAGCFWKLERAMRRVDGVVSTTAGYTGGEGSGPTHAAVSTGRTGHAEAVRVDYDPSAVSYDRLLEVFWAGHDPTQFTTDPGDAAPPGRSIIFYHTPEQRAAAEASKRRLRASCKYAADVPTSIIAASPFFPAESEHQQYLDRSGRAASCGLR